MILCDRPCSNKSEYGYCNTTYCINPVIPNTAVGYFPPPQTIKTNADRIRSMTDEELANKMSGLESFALTCGSGWPPEKWLEWLKAEVGE
jgi:hypothetical protein